MNVIRYTPAPADWAHHFGPAEPKLSIGPGDVVQVATEDCFGGLVTSPTDLPSEVVPFEALNPVTGPIFVNGAEPGDALAVHFIDIVPSRNTAISSLFPHFGALSPTHETALLSGPLPEKVWFYDLDLDRWTSRFRALSSDFSLDLPLDPMHGTVGVAPAAGESRLVMVPSTHGGNLDTPELRAGSTLYLPVNVDGALLALGDGHARQGEGEVTGTGLECAMHTVLTVEVIKGAAPAWPRLENATAIMSTGSIRPLEDAYRISQKDLVEWVTDLLPVDQYDAYQLVSQLGTAPVANVCDPNYTFVSRFPKSALGTAQAYGGVHARLAAVAEEYRSAHARIW
jgi:amidase